MRNSKGCVRYFFNPVTVQEYNQGKISLAFALQMQPCNKHITIKYNSFWSFIAKGDILIKHVGTKEYIAYIFTNPLDLKFFGYLKYKLNS